MTVTTITIIQAVCSIGINILTIVGMMKSFTKSMVTKDDLIDVTAQIEKLDVKVTDQIDKLDKKLDNNIEKEAHTCERVAVLEYALKINQNQ